MNRNICQDNKGPDVDVQRCMSAWTQQRIKADEVEQDVLDQFLVISQGLVAVDQLIGFVNNASYLLGRNGSRKDFTLVVNLYCYLKLLDMTVSFNLEVIG